MFFWVFPQRQIVVGRRFGTLCQFHLQRLGVEYEVWEEARYFIPQQGYKIPCFLSQIILYTQPLKMELTQGSETSANYNLTPGKYPKEHIQYSNHGKSLKSRILIALKGIVMIVKSPVATEWGLVWLHQYVKPRRIASTVCCAMLCS